MSHPDSHLSKVIQMSGASSTLSESYATNVNFGAVGSSIARVTLAPVQFVAFWAAVLLPFYALSLLYGGLTAAETALLGRLLAVNVLCFVVGHSYSR